MNDSPHILVVDDDREIRDLLCRYLCRHGMRVDAAADGREMRRAMETGRFDLLVLDLMLPGEDGLELCRKIRADAGPPIIMLTALGEEADRIVGLEMGADDYLPKPFNPRELLARIRAVLRRSGEPMRTAPRAEEPGILHFEGWRLDGTRRTLSAPDGMLVDLTAGEFDLLITLAKFPRRVLNRDQLLDLTRGRAAGPFDRSIDVQISRLRRKIEADPKNPDVIKTVRGGGYVFAAEVDQS